MAHDASDYRSRSLRLGRRTLLAAGGAALAMPYVSRAGFAADAINVGVVQPLSGANAQFGINSRNAIELVAEEINAAGGIKAMGGAKINLIVADATSTPTTAATVAQRMISQNNVVAVLGAFASSLSLAISEVTERRGIPLLTMSFTDQLTERGFKNVFQIVSKGSALGRAQVEDSIALAKQSGEEVRKIAILYEDTAYGTSQAEGLRTAAKAANIEIAVDEGYPHGITDVTPLVNKLRTSGAQLVFPVSYLNDSILIVRTMRQQGVTIPTVGGAAGYVIPDFVQALGDLADGVLSIAPANYDQAPEYTGRFRKRFGYFMVHEAIEHAALMGCLAGALERAKSRDPAAVREALLAHTFDTGWATVMTGGAVKFDATGHNVNAFPLMVQWQNRELATVFPKKVAKAGALWPKRG